MQAGPARALAALRPRQRARLALNGWPPLFWRSRISGAIWRAEDVGVMRDVLIQISPVISAEI